MAHNRQPKMPNTEKLFTYLQKSQWHNISANFSGFVRKEFNYFMDKLDKDPENCRNLRFLIDYSEMGRFTEAKSVLDSAMKEYDNIQNELEDMEMFKRSPRRYFEKSPNRDRNTPSGHGKDREMRRETTPNRGTPDLRYKHLESPRQRIEVHNSSRRPHDNVDTSRSRDTEPARHAMNNMDSNKGPSTHNSPRTKLEQDERLRTPQSPMKHNPHENGRERYGPDHTDELRLQYQDSRPGSQHSQPDQSRAHNESRPAAGTFNQSYQMASHSELWGRDHGDKASDKIGNSTYRQEFLQYPVDHHDRVDKDRYRDNFSTVERSSGARNDGHGDVADYERRQRYKNTPEYDLNRPSELARRFKELFNNEWKNAFDEIGKEFQSDTCKHLLWIIMEVAIIANDIADAQLRELERQAFGVMTAPDHSQRGRAGLPRNMGDSLPTSRSLLLKYRRQCAMLSIPYVQDECRDKVCRTLVESFGFSKYSVSDASMVVAYILKAAELIWIMSVQDPPIVLESITKETEGARFNKDHYTPYTRSGTTYDYGVWPMLRQGKNGPVISKGMAQGI